jgi:hypothetical protein
MTYRPPEPPWLATLPRLGPAGLSQGDLVPVVADMTVERRQVADYSRQLHCIATPLNAVPRFQGAIEKRRRGHA